MTETQTNTNFRLQGNKYHLTYKHHIPFNLIKEHCQEAFGARQVKWYSIVHEEGEENTETPYKHTHYAFQVDKYLSIKSARAFDIEYNGEQIHPHIKKIESNDHACAIFDDYHKKKPVALEQSTTRPIGKRGGQSVFEQVRTAPTLEQAMVSAGVGIKSVQDVLAIRNQQEFTVDHKYRDANWTRPLEYRFRCMYIYGESGTGKTQWALHCFRNPLLVSEYDDLQHFIGGNNAKSHDGIVFDDMQFTGKDNSWLINLLTWEETVSISVRYKTVRIPKGTRKIFTSNNPIYKTFPQLAQVEHPELWQREQWGQTSQALLRRLTLNGYNASRTNPPQIFKIEEKTFRAEAPPDNTFVVGRGIKHPRPWWEDPEESEDDDDQRNKRAKTQEAGTEVAGIGHGGGRGGGGYGDESSSIGSGGSEPGPRYGLEETFLDDETMVPSDDDSSNEDVIEILDDIEEEREIERMLEVDELVTAREPQPWDDFDFFSNGESFPYSIPEDD